MKKWISAMFAIFALLLLAAAGCGGTGSVVTIEDPDREITTITFFGKCGSDRRDHLWFHGGESGYKDFL